MKIYDSKIILVIFIFFFSFFDLLGTPTFTEDDLSEVDRLKATCRIWGFLKYYHPNVAKGNYDWDKQLFDVLPKVKTATNSEELSQIFIEWIDNLGVVKSCKNCERSSGIRYFNKNFDLDWINDGLVFSKELSERLRYIENNRHTGEKFFVDYFRGKGKIIYFKNEKEYIDFDWKNENFRLLSLFRYWNMVEYFFPAKYQMDKDWDEVLSVMISKYKNPKSKESFYQAMVELVVSLDDSHALVYPNSEFCNFGCLNAPVELKIIDTSAVITKIYDQKLAKVNDLKIGDVLIEVEGIRIKELFEANEKYIHGSNNSRKKINAGYYLLNGMTDSLNIKLIRNGKVYTHKIKRYPFDEFNFEANKHTKKYRLIDDNIGYINVGAVDVKEVPKIMSALSNTKAIIFDVRKTRGSTPYYFANYITSQKKDFYVAITPDLDYPGKFVWTDNYQSGNNKLKYKGEVILLVDEYCQSQLEFTAMCLQTGDNVTTIGRQTSGANGNIVKIDMIGDIRTQMTAVGIFYPNGKEAQRNGVEIDIKVEPDLNAFIQGKDEILERAINYANELD